MLDTIFDDMRDKMTRSEQSLAGEFSKVRTGRAHPQLLDHIKVASYGSEMPLAQVANVHVEGARNLLITPWDKSLVAACEKAIRQSDLGLNPATSGESIRVPVPPLTEERRRDLIKLVKELAENAKISMRNIRRAALQEVKSLLKDKEITEDEEKSATNNANKITQEAVEKVDAMLSQKEAELLEV